MKNIKYSMNIKEFLQDKKFEVDTKNTVEWKALGEELTKHFKTNCYWIPWKYEMYKIREAFKVCQKENKGFRYFLGILKK